MEQNPDKQVKIALGVTGCIAAYKAVEVLRGFQKLGASVQVVMTSSATRFIGPLTFQAISGLPVITAMFTDTEDPVIRHIALAGSIDLLLVAPATANVLAKFANGIADDFLSTLYISTTAPVAVAPAMNVEMWRHPATRANVERLKDRGVSFVDPEEGYLACRTVGAGRLADPAEIVTRAWRVIEGFTPPPESRQSNMTGERVLITAGPTYEAIDPVRGITNRSSGKMGYAIAEAALARGAEVTLISGPVALTAPPAARTVRAKSAAEMYSAVMNNLDCSTMVVMAAAVADYRPASAADQKIKKGQDSLTIHLEKTDDILSAVGRQKGSRILIGFAAETRDVVQNGRKKLVEKGADLIVANDVLAPDSGFDVDTNQVTLVSASDTVSLPTLSKREVADRILDAALRLRAVPAKSLAGQRG